MTAIRTGTSVVVTPRTSAGPAHSPDTAATAPRTDSDSFEVPSRRAARTGPEGSLRLNVAVDRGASGAYFHKVVAPARRDAHGIRVEGRLPQVEIDPTRQSLAGGAAPGETPVETTRQVLQSSRSLDAALTQLNDWRTGPTDKPSVYLGGRSGGQEADVGLSWDRVRDSQGRAVFTDLAGGSDLRQPEHQFVFDGATRTLRDGNGNPVARGDAQVKQFMIDRQLQPSFAFRPYWRVSPSEAGTENWTNPPPSAAQAGAWARTANHLGEPPANAYFYPGEQFAMNVRETGRGQLRLDIRGNGEDARVPAFGVGIRASGFGNDGPAEWKRVSSIDQKGREKKDVVSTSSRAIGMEWDRTEVLLGDDHRPTPLSELSPTQVRGRELAQSRRYDRIFNVDVVGGREIVSIRP